MPTPTTTSKAGHQTTATISKPTETTLGSHIDPGETGPLPARLRVFFPSGDICTEDGRHVASVRLEGWSNREALGRCLAAAPELLETLRSILVQDTGDLSDAAFRRYVCDVLVKKTLAKVNGGAK